MEKCPLKGGSLMRPLTRILLVLLIVGFFVALASIKTGNETLKYVSWGLIFGPMAISLVLLGQDRNHWISKAFRTFLPVAVLLSGLWLIIRVYWYLSQVPTEVLQVSVPETCVLLLGSIGGTIFFTFCTMCLCGWIDRPTMSHQ